MLHRRTTDVDHPQVALNGAAGSVGAAPRIANATSALLGAIGASVVKRGALRGAAVPVGAGGHGIRAREARAVGDCINVVREMSTVGLRGGSRRDSIQNPPPHGQQARSAVALA